MLWHFAKSDPDADLVAKARVGDHRAFNELVVRHQGAVVQFARSRLNSSIEAEDVAQDIFVAAWRQLPRFQGRARFRTWLFGIARNWCAEAARRGARSVESLTDLNETVEVHLASPWGAASEDAAPQLAEREAIRSWLGCLSAVEREVVELYYFGELTLREISELTRTNLSTIKTRFYQAHRRLRATADAHATARAPR